MYKKELSKITFNMNDHDRAKYLNNKTIELVKNDKLVFELTNEQKQKIQSTKRTIIKKDLRSIGEGLGIFKEYSMIGDTNLIAYYSKNNLFESVSKSPDLLGMYYVINNIENLLKYSIKIEEHTDNKLDRNNKLTHELLSILKIGNDEYYFIKATIKEQINNSNVHSLCNFQSIKKRDGHPQMFEVNQALETGHPSSSIIITQLIKYVNSPDILRYIPDELLSKAQLEIKKDALVKYKNIKNKWK